MPALKQVADFLTVGLVMMVAFHFTKRRLELPVKFQTRDELDAFTRVVAWAHRRIDRQDPRWKAIEILYTYFVRSTFFGMTFVALTRISTEDLGVLVPFVDQFIEGKGPPPLLSPEYEQWVPTTLMDFKARMKAEGLWPAEFGRTSK